MWVRTRDGWVGLAAVLLASVGGASGAMALMAMTTMGLEFVLP